MYAVPSLIFVSFESVLQYKKKDAKYSYTVNPLYLANLVNLTFSLIFKDAELKRRQQYFSPLK